MLSKVSKFGHSMVPGCRGWPGQLVWLGAEALTLSQGILGPGDPPGG